MCDMPKITFNYVLLSLLLLFTVCDDDYLVLSEAQMMYFSSFEFLFYSFSHLKGFSVNLTSSFFFKFYFKRVTQIHGSVSLSVRPFTFQTKQFCCLSVSQSVSQSRRPTD